jgi:hypothetical protein
VYDSPNRANNSDFVIKVEGNPGSETLAHP